MKNIKEFESFLGKKVNESFWNRVFGRPDIDSAAKSNLKGQGYSVRGRDEDEQNYVMFNGQKFYPSDIEYDDYYSTKPLPRVENGKLIIANPGWDM